MSNQAGFPSVIPTARRWDFLGGVMLENGYKNFVEVGCKAGQTTGAILKMVPDARVIAIDPWQPMPQQKGVEKGETYEDWDFAKIEAEFIANVGENKARCDQWRMPSLMAASAYMASSKLASPDLIFIDAAHDYDSVMDDIRAWWPMVKEGGMLAGHDFNHKWPSVQRAVAESFDLLQVGVGPDSVWFVIKSREDQLRD